MITDTLGAPILRRVWQYTYDEYDQLSGTNATDSMISGVIQIMDDTDWLVKQGLLKQGDAIGFFEPGTTVNGSDYLQFPSGTGVWYVVTNLYTEYMGATPVFQEANLERVKGE